MSRFLIFCVALGIYAGQATTASAGPLSELLTFNAERDSLIDESVSIGRDVGTNVGFLDVGDVVQGVFTIDNIVSDSEPGGTDQVATPTADVGTLIGITSLMVESIGVTPFGTTYSFVATPSANPLSLESMLTEAGNVFDLNGMTGLDEAGFALLERSDVGLALNGLGLDESDTALGLDADDWDVSLLGGFDGDDDFYQAAFIPLFGPPGAPIPITPTGPASLPVGFFNTAFSVLDQNIGQVTFLPLDTTDFFGTPATGDIISGAGASLSLRDASTPAGFPISDRGTFFINAVPEPSSYIIGLIGAAGLVPVLRRRKKKE